MFDKNKKAPETLHRIYVEWDGGYFMTSLHDSAFHKNLQEMIAELGPPIKVEFRDENEKWFESRPGEE